MIKGSKHTKKVKQKMSLANKGKEPWNKGMRGIVKSNSGSFKKGFTPWNKGKIGVQIAWNKGKKDLVKMSLEIRRKMSETHKKNPTNYWLDKRHTFEYRKKMSEATRGEKANNWQGGITPINEAIRHSFEYEEWRTKVFERDNYTCQNCKEVGGYLEADHIKPFSRFPELRFEISNGRTLCKPCHKEIGWNLFKEDNPRRKHDGTGGNILDIIVQGRAI